jgi:hypothetical protein
MTQKESKLNLEMAAQQRRLAHASKRDSTAMKTLSLLGAIFLPGTFLASVFSMTFFNFKVGESRDDQSTPASPSSQPSTTIAAFGNSLPTISSPAENREVSEELWVRGGLWTVDERGGTPPKTSISSRALSAWKPTSSPSCGIRR